MNIRMERGPREIYHCNLIYISIVDLHNKMICTHLNVRTAQVARRCFKSLKRLAREHEKIWRTANVYYHLDASISLSSAHLRQSITTHRTDSILSVR